MLFFCFLGNVFLESVSSRYLCSCFSHGFLSVFVFQHLNNKLSHFSVSESSPVVVVSWSLSETKDETLKM